VFVCGHCVLASFVAFSRFIVCPIPPGRRNTRKDQDGVNKIRKLVIPPEKNRNPVALPTTFLLSNVGKLLIVTENMKHRKSPPPAHSDCHLIPGITCKCVSYQRRERPFPSQLSIHHPSLSSHLDTIVRQREKISGLRPPTKPYFLMTASRKGTQTIDAGSMISVNIVRYLLVVVVVTEIG
jgi:hypothetical protein